MKDEEKGRKRKKRIRSVTRMKRTRSCDGSEKEKMSKFENLASTAKRRELRLCSEAAAMLMGGRSFPQIVSH